MAKVEMLESSDEDEQPQNDADKIAKEREKRKLERIKKKRKKSVDYSQKSIFKSDNEIVALELHKTYQTNKEKWIKSYRGFPLNLPLASIISGLVVCPMLLALLLLPLKDFRLWKIVGICLTTSLISYYISLKLIPELRGYMLEAKIFGKDLNKTGQRNSKPPIPEAMGIITCLIFLLNAIIMITLLDFSKDKILLYMTGLLCITIMILLGFVDDVVALKWKYKLILPFVASLSLLFVYDGNTSIVLPIPVRFLLGKTLELGIFYKIYFVALTIF